MKYTTQIIILVLALIIMACAPQAPNMLPPQPVAPRIAPVDQTAGLPPAPSPPATPPSSGSPLGQATSYTGEYYTGDADVMNSSNQVIFIQPQDVVVRFEENNFTITVNVSYPDAYIFQRGYIYTSKRGWVPFDMNGTTPKGRVWLEQNALAKIKVLDKYSFDQGLNYVVIFACKKVTTSGTSTVKWYCGAQTHPKIASKWMLSAFNLTMQKVPTMPTKGPDVLYIANATIGPQNQLFEEGQEVTFTADVFSTQADKYNIINGLALDAILDLVSASDGTIMGESMLRDDLVPICTTDVCKVQYKTTSPVKLDAGLYKIQLIIPEMTKVFTQTKYVSVKSKEQLNAMIIRENILPMKFLNYSGMFVNDTVVLEALYQDQVTKNLVKVKVMSPETEQAQTQLNNYFNDQLLNSQLIDVLGSKVAQQTGKVQGTVAGLATPDISQLWAIIGKPINITTDTTGMIDVVKYAWRNNKQYIMTDGSATESTTAVEITMTQSQDFDATPLFTAYLGLHPSNIQYTCEDTDQGVDAAKLGKIIVYNNNKQEIWADHCALNSNKILVEYACTGPGQYNYTMVDCSTGGSGGTCKDGACVGAEGAEQEQTLMELKKIGEACSSGYECESYVCGPQDKCVECTTGLDCGSGQRCINYQCI